MGLVQGFGLALGFNIWNCQYGFAHPSYQDELFGPNTESGDLADRPAWTIKTMVSVGSS